MEQITQWVTDNWVLLLAIGAAIETLAGIIPDKWVPYIGAIRKFLMVIKGKGKAGNAEVSLVACVAMMSAFYVLIACATGPSQYAADNPDSYPVKAIQAAGMTPEGVQEQISAIVQSEIAMGTFSKEDALNYMAGLEAYLNDGASYGQANALIESYMTQYLAKSDPISHAAVLAYYLFKPHLKVPDLNVPIVEADRKVLQDLFASVRADLGE